MPIKHNHAMAFQQEPQYTHGQAARTAIIWCNLGTPEAPTAPALRRYLGEFLADPRVVEIPRAIWWLILHGIILRVRPAKSAAKYATIWTDQGSPLKTISEAQAQALATRLSQRGHEVAVHLAMRYGAPAVGEVVAQAKAAGAQRVLILPAYPQYSGTTTASVFDAVYDWARRTRWVPEFRFVNQYHDHPTYIQALAARVRAHWAEHGRGEHLLMSFHGVPERTLHLGDPYHCHCHKTARLLAQALDLAPEDWTLSFQSRFGKAKWLEPYTEPTAIALAQGGTRQLDVICPGFTSDCLETLEEIAGEVREAFEHAGGEQLRYIGCLNTDDAWLDAMADIAEQHLSGWPTTAQADPEQAQRARALGATQ
jgi:ferrochelatase